MLNTHFENSFMHNLTKKNISNKINQILPFVPDILTALTFVRDCHRI